MVRVCVWTVPIALALLLATGATGHRAATESAHARGYLTLDGQTGAALPTKDGVSLVNVDCRKRRGGGTCAGTVRLLARDAQTRALVGSAPIAAGWARLHAGGTKTLRLTLSKRARAAIRGKGNVLNVMVEVRSNGKRWTHPALVDDFAPFVGHKRPNSSRRLRLLTASGAVADVLTLEWKWGIPVRHYLVLPEFTCGSNHPYVATNDVTIWVSFNLRWVDVGLQGKLDVTGTSHAGYAGFNVPTIIDTGGVGHLYLMTGWPQGDWGFNSVWAPVAFDDGHFELRVTCTSSDQITKTDVAHIFNDDLRFLFPWGA